MTSFLQSREWTKFQKSLGREVLEYPENLEVEPLSKEAQPPVISAKIIKHNLPFGKSYLYIPHGPEIDFNQMIGGFKNPVANFVRWLREESKKRKSIFIKTEPLIDSIAQALVEAGFKKSKKEIQPSKTVVVDLTKSENELLAAMHHKTRYNIGVADKRGIIVGEEVTCTTCDVVQKHDIACRAEYRAKVETFLKLLKKTAKRDRFNPHPDDYYRKLLDYNGLQTKLYFAKHNNKPFDKTHDKPIATALILTYGDAGYYLHGASDYENRALMAPYALHWHIMKQLKAEGLKRYDFWGIDPRKWPGVTRFKLGWGGNTIEYPGSFDLPISKFWYLVYRLARKIF
ncbi:MAG: peptidoglycan bridge formation glycyltransferase FemA/FemB family protein [Candidatus Yanofskybacteria bacterium]|nr:peptidoglycan bridge formation glycyltransferase FemA/FemB family protein [Candidatus Yanofskybacteria bacterium]